MLLHETDKAQLLAPADVGANAPPRLSEALERKIMKLIKLIATTLAVTSIVSGNVAEGGQKQKMKTYGHSAFSVAVPLDWEETPDSNDETIILRSKNGKDQLTISVMYFKPGTKREEVKKSFERYLETRREAERTETKGKAMLTDAKITDKGEYLFTKYGGYEKSSDRRFIALVTAENGKLLTFYVESLRTSDEHTNQLAAEIFNSAEIK